ncbi:MAG: glycosyltransferase family protein [Anaerolineaceae bacterium]|nr:glycosyltransferase family protein [Anaerolineaceae bacterium]
MDKEKTVCIIQARMASSRLPGKVLKDISGYPMIYWVVSRAKQAKNVDEVVIATTVDDADDAIVDWCLNNGIKCFRGDPLDVLDRFYQCAKFTKADTVVRITADCPLIDPSLIDAVVAEYSKRQVDFAANRLPPPYKRTFPIGLDVEVVSLSALEKAWRDAKQLFEREHVMPHFYAVEGRFKIFILDYKEDFGDQRWTVDTQKDLEFIRRLFSLLKDKKEFSWLDVLAVVNKNPGLGKINAHVHHKSFMDIDERAK